MAETTDLTTKDPLNPFNFKLQIRRCPSVNFNIQGVGLPGVSGNAVEVPTMFLKYPLPGDQMIFDKLKIKFMVDEDLQNWFEIFDWIVALNNPLGFDEYLSLEKIENFKKEGPVSDVSVHLQTGTRDTNIVMNYIDAFPISMSGIGLTTTATGTTYVTSEATFTYSYFKPTKYLY